MAAEKSKCADLVSLGYISGVHGVNGWVKIHSFTEPREAILDYQPWLLGETLDPAELRSGKTHGKTVLASLRGVEDRDQALALKGESISVDRAQLPDPGPERYYWADLIGLEVCTEGGVRLGQIEKMMATGANDVMVVGGGRERLIPFLTDRTVRRVDLEDGKIWVDWDPDF